jgi:pimeloyl-ACP methyl ester carboxylesterase
MWVEWEAAKGSSDRPPVIMIHGGGGQGTDWLVTPDGRPGWAREFVDAGYPVYVVDRPGHGRSSQPADIIGAQGRPGPIEQTAFLFAPSDAQAHTQWPWSRSILGAELLQLSAGSGALLADLAEVNHLDAMRISALLDITGQAILVSHSLGSIGAWSAANLRPDLVAGIVAIEPAGPPYGSIPGVGELSAGITALPLTLDDSGRVRGISGVPIAIVSGSASRFRPGAIAVLEHIGRFIGADVALLALEDIAIVGNGHGLMFEANSSATAAAVINWIRSRIQ